MQYPIALKFGYVIIPNIKSMEREQKLRSLEETLNSLIPKELSIQNIKGIGLDICDVNRIQKDIEIGAFIVDNFSDEEIVYCEQAAQPSLRAQRYAARFAAKEAVIKALGGIDREGFSFQDITILKGTVTGKPYIFLDGKAKSRADALGVKDIFISFAHVKDLAVAFCAVTG